MKARLLFAALAAFTFATAVLAQTPSPSTRIRGTITAFDGANLTIASREGPSVMVALNADARLVAILPAKLADVKPGSYIGTAALPQPDGSLMAMEVQVFPEAMRGVGEGTRPWDLRPDSTMTNGTVGDVAGVAGRTMTVKYKGEEKKVVVPAEAPVITYEPATKEMLSVGAHVIVTAAKAADGTLHAAIVGVGKDGLTPPM